MTTHATTDQHATHDTALLQLRRVSKTACARFYDGNIIAATHDQLRLRHHCPALATVVSMTRSMIQREQYDAAYWAIRDQRLMDAGDLSAGALARETGRRAVYAERGYAYRHSAHDTVEQRQQASGAYLTALERLEDTLDQLRNGA
jgi:hypothetical protein